MFGRPMSAAQGFLLGHFYGKAMFGFLFSWPGVIFLLLATGYYHNWFLPDFNSLLTPQKPLKPDPAIVQMQSPTYQPQNSFEYKIQGDELVKSSATWPQGIRDLHKSAELSKDNPVWLASAYSSIAIGYARKGDRDQAIRYFKLSIEIDEHQAIVAKSKMMREGSQASVQINRGYLRSCEFFRCRSVP